MAATVRRTVVTTSGCLAGSMMPRYAKGGWAATMQAPWITDTRLESARSSVESSWRTKWGRRGPWKMVLGTDPEVDGVDSVE
jgi:hypothetical protein